MSDYMRYKLIQTARNRIWAMILLHLLFSPLGSAIYCGKQNNWLPFAAGTGIFVPVECPPHSTLDEANG